MKDKETPETIEMRNKDAAAPSCAHAEDLVAYLYGEAGTIAAHNFETHMQRCVSCRTELAAFGHVRTSIGEWRNQALGALSLTAAPASVPVIAPLAVERRPSALAAIREFFSLSPLWLRAATAAIGVVFCALIALTIARSLEQPKIVTVEKTVAVKPSDAELDAMIAARLKQKGETLPNASENKQAGPTIENASLPKDKPAQNANRVLRPNAARQSNLARNRPPALKISPQESREIARDLRLVAANDDDDLPRLTDLIDESTDEAN
jgi:hypothetical protein